MYTSSSGFIERIDKLYGAYGIIPSKEGEEWKKRTIRKGEFIRFPFFFFFFSQTRATDTRLKTRAHVNSPPFLHPSSPPLPSRRFLSRKRENVVVQKLLCRVPPGVYDLSLAPHFFLSIFLPRSPRHAVSTPTQTRQRSVHEWNSASNRNAPPCASPSLGKKRGGGEPKFSRISRLHRAAITFLPLARTSFYIDSIRCVYREQRRRVKDK